MGGDGTARAEATDGFSAGKHLFLCCFKAPDEHRRKRMCKYCVIMLLIIIVEELGAAVRVGTLYVNRRASNSPMAPAASFLKLFSMLYLTVVDVCSFCEMSVIMNGNFTGEFSCLRNACC